MMDDHGLTEKEATELFQKQNSIRKRKSLSILHDQIEIKKIKVREICQKKYNILVWDCDKEKLPFLGNSFLQQTFGGIC